MDIKAAWEGMDRMQRAGVKIRIHSNAASIALSDVGATSVQRQMVEDAIAAELRGDPLPPEPLPIR